MNGMLTSSTSTCSPTPSSSARSQEFAKPTDTILVMCRSGGRSAMAVNRLAEAGFTNVYNITDGMEGDEVKDPDSVYQGQRLVNGWKNSRRTLDLRNRTTQRLN